MKRLIFFLLISLAAALPDYAQDTLRLTLEEAQQKFVQRNFALIAQKYNVNIAEASVQQAKLWYNPNLFVETNLYNGYTHKILPYGKQTDLVNPTGGVFNIQLQQQAKMRMLNEERTRLESLLTAFRAQLSFGVIAPYEVTRLELEQKNFEKDLSDLRVQIAQDEAAMRVLLATGGSVYILPAESAVANQIEPGLGQLLDLAFSNRPDLKMADQQISYNQNNLIYQKSLATPNLTIGADYQTMAEYGIELQ